VTSNRTNPYIIGIPVYDGVDLLDVCAPCEVFGWMADSWNGPRPVQVLVLAQNNGSVQTRGRLPIVPHRTFDQVKALDLLWVPGGDPAALAMLMKDSMFLAQLRAWSEHAEYVTSVCEGAMLLAAAGLLDGHRATTHWAFTPCLRKYKKITVIGEESGSPRFVVDPKDPPPGARGVRVTGAGVSAGLDEALELVRRIAGEDIATQVQVSIQYFPDPPVHGTLPVPTSCPPPLDAL